MESARTRCDGPSRSLEAVVRPSKVSSFSLFTLLLVAEEDGEGVSGDDLRAAAAKVGDEVDGGAETGEA